MAITNHDPVGKALQLLKGGVGPFVRRGITSTTKIAQRPRLAGSWAKVTVTLPSEGRDSLRRSGSCRADRH